MFQCDSLDELNLTLSKLIRAFAFAGFDVPLRCNKLVVLYNGFQHYRAQRRRRRYINFSFEMTSPESGLPSANNTKGESFTSTSTFYPKVEAADVHLNCFRFDNCHSRNQRALWISGTMLQDGAVPTEFEDHAMITLASRLCQTQQHKQYERTPGRTCVPHHMCGTDNKQKGEEHEHCI